MAFLHERVSASGVELHVVTAGEPGAPPVLLLHGFPDDHAVWTDVMQDLARDHHVAAFDLRGVGDSGVPVGANAYAIVNVLPDITAVIDAVFGPGSTTHLVGHDWGSVLGFSYVACAEGRARVRSFTSVSGPHAALMLSATFRHLFSGVPSMTLFALRQLLSSYYVFAFQLPKLPERLLELGGADGYRQALSRGGAPLDHPYLNVTRDEVRRRAQRTLGLYRQNALTPPPVPEKGSITVPVNLVVPLHDPFVRPEVHAFLGEYVPDLRIEELDASHWVPLSHPAQLAASVRRHVARVDSTRDAR